MNLTDLKEALCSRVPIMGIQFDSSVKWYSRVESIVLENVCGDVVPSAELIEEHTGYAETINDISKLRTVLDAQPSTNFPDYIVLRRRGGLTPKDGIEALLNKRPVILHMPNSSPIEYEYVSAVIYSNNRGSIAVSVRLTGTNGKSHVVAHPSWVNYREKGDKTMVKNYTEEFCNKIKEHLQSIGYTDVELVRIFKTGSELENVYEVWLSETLIGIFDTDREEFI